VRCRRSRIKGRITLSGYEGSELIWSPGCWSKAALIFKYVGTALPKTRFSDPDREWLQAQGVHVEFRASLEQDLAAMAEFKPDLAIGTTPVVQKAKEQSIPCALLHQPDLGASADGARRSRVAGAVVNAALATSRALTDEGLL
jgi:chlorophyllide a reductase subunit Y